jgi:uncharacterized membrane protein YccC
MKMGLFDVRRPRTWIAPLTVGMTWPRVGFALRTTAASLISLYLALLISLDDPQWAPMTVWIVAQNNRGMTLSKSRYRMLGTIAGAGAALVLVALFAQTCELFIPALGIWLALCTAAATGLRNFRAYGAVLAGYTAAIIAMDAISAPEEVFDIAVARVAYISLGITTEAVLTTIFAPGAPLGEIRDRLAGYLRQTAEICARALRGEANTAAIHRLFAGALDLDVAAEYAAASSSAVRSRFGHLRATTAAALAQMAAAQSLREHLTTSADPPTGLITEIAALFDDIAASPMPDRSGITALALRVEAALSDEAGRACGSVSSRLLVLDRLDTLLAAAHDAFVQQTLFLDGKAPSSRTKFAFHVDHIAAIHNGIRSFVALGVGSIFWILTGWTSGPNFVALLCVVCALFATRPNPVAAGLGFLKGGCLAALAAALCNFALLPTISDFTSLALVLGVFLVGTGLALGNPRFAAPATSFAFLFLDMIRPENSGRVEASTFINDALAILLGIACGIVVFALLFPVNPQAARTRIHHAVRRDLARIGRAPERYSAEGWLSQTADRLNRQLITNSAVTEDQAEADLRGILAALTIGDASIALHHLARRQPTLRKPLAAVLRRLAHGDPTALAATARAAAQHLMRQVGTNQSPTNRSLLRSAVLLHEIARSATAHLQFLRRRR